jgi:hypothetical protein
MDASQCSICRRREGHTDLMQVQLQRSRTYASRIISRARSISRLGAGHWTAPSSSLILGVR